MYIDIKFISIIEEWTYLQNGRQNGSIGMPNVVFEKMAEIME